MQKCMFHIPVVPHSVVTEIEPDRQNATGFRDGHPVGMKIISREIH